MHLEAFINMLLEYMYKLGLFEMAGLLVGVFVLLAVAGVFFAHRLPSRFTIREDTSGFGQLVSGPIGNVFALVFALVTIAIWQNYDAVSGRVSEEAAALHNIYRSLDAYPAQVRDPARTRLKAYVNRVATEEWQHLASVDEGDEDEEAHRLITEANEGMVAYQPRNLGEVPLHQVLLTEIGRARSLRHARLEAGKAYMDTGMWVCLDMGAMILLFFCCFWRLSNRREHLFMAIALGASLGLVFFLMIIYNHPFAGPTAISPSPFQALLKNWK
jgi:hypothetical protein